MPLFNYSEKSNKKISLIEVGPRDGFQFEAKIIPTELKIKTISDLADAGLKHIQVTSFVNPKLIPQMADAEKLYQSIPKKKNIIYSGLALNLKGIERANRIGVRDIEISISASNTHSKKNSGMSLEQAILHGKKMVTLAQKYNMNVRAGIQCAFGCAYEGSIPQKRILKIAQDFLSLNVNMLALADTTGMATPNSIIEILSEILPLSGKTPVVMHLHDTRGLGLINAITAIECGVTYFDTALAGMGGCPFVPGASGNIATEDMAYLMESLNMETGVDINKVAKCSKQIEKIVGKQFSGKIYRILK